MPVLNPTPTHALTDASRRPYFLWDVDMTLDEFVRRLRDDQAARPYLMAKLMRQAKPDDVFTFVSLADIRANWPLLEPMLGNTRPFWTWLLARWEAQGVG